MTERAIKPKQPVKRKKKAIKAAKVDTPQPNSVAEAAIFVGSLGMIVCAVLVFVGAWFAMVMVSASGHAESGLALTLAVSLFGINVAVQGGLLLKETHRVDRYGQRIAAIYMTIAPLVLSALSMIVAALYGGKTGGCIYDDGSNILCAFARETTAFLVLSFKFSPAISVFGSIYVWFLLACKDKLFWIYDESSKGSNVYKKAIGHSKEYRKIGSILLAIPPLMLVARFIVIFFGGYSVENGDSSAWIIPALIDYFFGYFIWVIYIIAGIIFFVKSK